MPDGVVQWFDPATARAAVVRGSQVFLAEASDVEPAARHAGARVHFDIHRDNGAERAVNVTLRRGTRVSPRQRRFGTLAGARRPDTKGPAPFARPHPERGRALASHPLEVARAWVDALRRRDLDAAVALYTRDALVHTAPNEWVAGHRHIRSYLESGPWFGLGREPHVRGEEDVVVVTWPETAPVAPTEVRLRVEHGLITEQWVGTGPAPRRAEATSALGPVDVTVVTHGNVHESDVDYAIERLGPVLGTVDEPVLLARLKLTRAADPARDRPAMIQVTLDINGDVVRAQVAAREMREAADLLQRRLRDQLDHRAEQREFLRTREAVPQPGQWRRGMLPSPRPSYVERPPEERQLVRHKTFATEAMTPDEAAFDMELLDYSFYLYRDLATGEDAVLQRRPDGSYLLSRLHATSADPGPTAVPVKVDDRPAPVLAVAEAIERLDVGAEPFVFFANRDTGRGNVVYRRYDGHYGLLTPADAGAVTGEVA